ncbi:TonB-dependent copper receptor [Endozoicomonas lisbonensis]|uniref:Iron complex outermembrane receptor protein n=1 Tax=Endozoicomonas lisbonensis TaxID=3120522 RepID=A0ABV2SLF6_9GAMM
MKKLRLFPSVLFGVFCGVFVGMFAGILSPAIRADDVPDIAVDVSESLLPSESVSSVSQVNIPATDAGQALREITGVTASRKGGKGFEPIIRGQQQSQLNVLMDGAYVHGACPGRMDPPTTYVSRAGYDKVEVIRGYESVIYGAGGSGGTVLFTRDDPDFNNDRGMRWHPSVTGRVNMGYTGNSRAKDLSLDIAAGNSENWLRAYGAYQDGDNYKDGSGNKVSSAFHSNTGGLIISGEVAGFTRMELNVESVRDDDVYYSGNGMDAPWAKADIWRFKTRYDQSFLLFDTLELSAYRSDVEHRMDNYSVRRRKPTVPNGLKAPSSSLTWGGRLQGSVFTEKSELRIGVDYQANDRDARRYKVALDNRSQADQYQSHMWPGVEYRQAGLFAELDYELSDKNHLRVGGRYDDFKAEATKAAAGTLGASSPDALYQKYYGYKASKVSEGNSSGLVSWVHDLSSAQSVELRASRSVRTADASERYIASRGSCCHGSDDWVGNPRIKPEIHHQLDAGYQFQTEQAQFRVMAFVDEVNDFILRTSGETGARLYKNVDARLYGVEMESRYDVGHWQPAIGLSWTRGENRDDSQQKNLPQIPPLMGSIKLDYNTGHWLLGARCEFAARQNKVDTQSGLDVGESSGYGVMHLHGWYQLAKGLKLQGGVENLFDRTYALHVNRSSRDPFNPEALRVHEPGRQLWVGVEVLF